MCYIVPSTLCIVVPFLIASAFIGTAVAKDSASYTAGFIPALLLVLFWLAVVLCYLCYRGSVTRHNKRAYRLQTEAKIRKAERSGGADGAASPAADANAESESEHEEQEEAAKTSDSRTRAQRAAKARAKAVKAQAKARAKAKAKARARTKTPYEGPWEVARLFTWKRFARGVCLFVALVLIAMAADGSPDAIKPWMPFAVLALAELINAVENATAAGYSKTELKYIRALQKLRDGKAVGGAMPYPRNLGLGCFGYYLYLWSSWLWRVLVLGGVFIKLGDVVDGDFLPWAAPLGLAVAGLVYEVVLKAPLHHVNRYRQRTQALVRRFEKEANPYTRSRTMAHFTRVYYSNAVARLVLSELALIPALLGLCVLGAFIAAEGAPARAAVVGVVNGYVMCIVVGMGISNIYLYIKATLASDAQGRERLQRIAAARAQAKRDALRNIKTVTIHASTRAAMAAAAAAAEDENSASRETSSLYDSQTSEYTGESDSRAAIASGDVVIMMPPPPVSDMSSESAASAGDGVIIMMPPPLAEPEPEAPAAPADGVIALGPPMADASSSYEYYDEKEAAPRAPARVATRDFASSSYYSYYSERDDSSVSPAPQPQPFRRGVTPPVSSETSTSELGRGPRNAVSYSRYSYSTSDVTSGSCFDETYTYSMASDEVPIVRQASATSASALSRSAFMQASIDFV
ncbi:uncharacterized protein AMSG_10477 [Thecamonas trahens ATCC 50062]|uniref:Uncharacterized protein n=1 Tax=Thecamonas trahens ATCC 50062 TaxID=461836 RepID=A0A0L0DQD1_THETB|nr:hypothetical protein AMSG_10477 [Thecamonas trahens ATCC 50062]KNC54480.1 hypothetical protein AMSG_10477 [Thecamonas trahens ATCC 50062]|eukprot:XP_013753634.1 hypothetical protein AMSG_10477 [Thecamonas trahens ATCC 50062]